jgi:hypothetical protein
MGDDHGQWQHASKPTIDWRALFSWTVIVLGFSVATFLFLL